MSEARIHDTLSGYGQGFWIMVLHIGMCATLAGAFRFRDIALLSDYSLDTVGTVVLMSN